MSDNPEAFSRILIDRALEDSGWNLLDSKQVRFEFHTGSGRTDYLLLDSAGRVLCVLEAKVKEYFEDLMKSKSKSYRGKLLNLDKETPKFAYIICEIDKDLEEYMLGFGGFARTSSKTYYRYLGPINLYIEVMTYQTMLANVEIRHKAFFKQLGIDYI